MGYWKVWVAILVVCRCCANRRLNYAGLRFVSQQEHLFPHCFGTFPISSFPFHFVLSENNQKIISTQASRKMVNARTLQQKYKPSIELPENSLPRLHKAQYRNQRRTSETLWDLYTHHWKLTTGHILDWKTNLPAKAHSEIFMIIFGF